MTEKMQATTGSTSVDETIRISFSVTIARLSAQEGKETVAYNSMSVQKGSAPATDVSYMRGFGFWTDINAQGEPTGASGMIGAQNLPAKLRSTESQLVSSMHSMTSSVFPQVPHGLLHPGQTWTTNTTLNVAGLDISVQALNTYTGLVHGLPQYTTHGAMKLTPTAKLPMSGTVSIQAVTSIDPMTQQLATVTSNEVENLTVTTQSGPVHLHAVATVQILAVH